MSDHSSSNGRIDLMNVDENAATKSGDDSKNVKERVTSKYMTKYERARVLGTRALQIRFVSTTTTTAGTCRT